MIRRLHILPFSLLSLLVLAETQQKKYTNSSSSSTPSCTSCTVTAFETFLTYPNSVETTEVPITVTKIPLVTVHPDGSRETNYQTVTQKANVTGTFAGIPDPYAKLTWVVEDVTLTYPTTYVSFVDLSGGLFTPAPPGITPACQPDVKPLDLPNEGTASGLIVPVTQSVNLQNPTAVSAPPQVMTYLNGIPAVSSQFSGTDVAKCSWTKTMLHRTETFVETTEVPVQKVSVSVLTEVTAPQRVITAPVNQPITATPAVAHVESSDGSALIAPPNPTPQPGSQPQGASQPSSSPDIAGNIVAILGVSSSNTGSNSNSGSSNGNNGGSPNGNSGSSNNNGGSPTNSESGSGSGSGSQPGGNSGSPGSNSGSGNGDSGNGGGSGSGSGSTKGASGSEGASQGSEGGSPQPGSPAGTAPLVLTLGGTVTTVKPTVIPGAQGSVTAFVLGPGSTLVAGGVALTLPDTTLSLPTVASGRASAAGTTTGAIGAAIASGIGYTGPVATGRASHTGIDLPIWVAGTISSIIGAIAIFS